jgi:HAD superfamily hydrolase (TIGR01484 family)
VHETDREAVEALAARGVPTTIVTGRLYSGTRHVAERIGIRGVIGCADGSHLVDHATGSAVLHATIAGERAARMREVMQRASAIKFVFAQDQVVHDDEGEPVLGYVRTWSRDLVRAERVTDHPHWEHEAGVTAVVAIGDGAEIERTCEALEGAIGDAAYVVRFPVARAPVAGIWAMLVRAAGHTKGTALARIADLHGITPAEIVAVGDWHNDIPMFAVAGRSFVMGQAPEDVKRTATDRLEAHSGTGGGILEAARRAGWL